MLMYSGGNMWIITSIIQLMLDMRHYISRREPRLFLMLSQYPLVEFFEGVALAGLEGELLLGHGLGVELGEGVGGAAEGGVERPVGLVQPRRRVRLPLPGHRRRRRRRSWGRREGGGWRSTPSTHTTASPWLIVANPTDEVTRFTFCFCSIV